MSFNVLQVSCGTVVCQVKAVLFSALMKCKLQQQPHIAFVFLCPGVLLPRHRPPTETWDCESTAGPRRTLQIKTPGSTEHLSLVFLLREPQNMADIKKMKSVGICTVKGIQMTTRKALCNIKGLSEAKVEKIKEAAGKMLVNWDSPPAPILQPALLCLCLNY